MLNHEQLEQMAKMRLFLLVNQNQFVRGHLGQNNKYC